MSDNTGKIASELHMMSICLMPLMGWAISFLDSPYIEIAVFAWLAITLSPALILFWKPSNTLTDLEIKLQTLSWDEIEELIRENYAARFRGELPDEWFPPDEYYFCNAPKERRDKFYGDSFTPPTEV